MPALPSTTQVLQIYSDFSKIPTDTMEAAQDRGDEVHKLMAAYLLDWPIGNISPAAQGYFDSGRRWIDKMVEKVALVDQELRNDTYGYTGSPDLIASLRGDTRASIIDFKTSAAPSPTWPLQLGGYYGLAQDAGHNIGRFGYLPLRKDGKMPKLSDFTENIMRLHQTFLCALTVWRHFNP